VVLNEVIYIGSTNGTLTALDARSGAKHWQFQADSAFFSTPLVSGTTIYACSQGGGIYALNLANGKLLWQRHLTIPGAKIWASPALDAGVLIVSNASDLSEQPKAPGYVMAFDATTGKQRWQTATEPNGAPGGGVWSSAAIDPKNQLVYTGTGDPDDGAQALDLRTGKRIWHWRSVVKDVGDTDIGAGPLLYQDATGKMRVALGGKSGQLYSLDAQTGKLLWQSAVGAQIYSSPVFVSGTIYTVAVTGHQSMARAIDAQTGKPRWQHEIPVIVYASPAISGQNLYLAIGNAFSPDGTGGMQVVNAQTGQLIQSIALHSNASSSPALLPNWLFVGVQNGLLYAFKR
jgi:outer membrane protein assembly factor BamB